MLSTTNIDKPGLKVLPRDVSASYVVVIAAVTHSRVWMWSPLWQNFRPLVQSCLLPRRATAADRIVVSPAGRSRSSFGVALKRSKLAQRGCIVPRMRDVILRERKIACHEIGRAATQTGTRSIYTVSTSPTYCVARGFRAAVVLIFRSCASGLMRSLPEYVPSLP